MKILGLITEYNPFHNGHLYHLHESQRLTGCDYTVCVMSGNFIQRGEPSIVNKWSRAKAALKSGIDLVIELPSVYAMASAEYFAFGAIKILYSLGIVDCLCFGSESGSIKDLSQISDILSEENAQFKDTLKRNLEKGVSFPTARESAVSECLQNIDRNELKGVLASPNNILGIEYLKAIKRLESNIKPYTIARVSNDYNDTNLTGKLSSATSIRKAIESIGDNSFINSIPIPSYQILLDEFKNGRGPITKESFDMIIFSILRSLSSKELSGIPYVSEGLENRLKAAAEVSKNVEELISNSVSKRYTITRIQRILFHLITGLKASEFNTFNRFGGPQYIRILGFNENGKKILAMAKGKATLPVIVKAADYKKSCNSLLRRMLEIESHATDLYVLGYGNAEFRKSGQEFTQNIIRI